jgi:AraC-like DNA-binding protein
VIATAINENKVSHKKPPVPFSVFARDLNPSDNNFSQWLQLSVVRYTIINHLRSVNPSRYKLPFWLIYRNFDPGAEIIDERDVRVPLDPDTILVLPPWQEWRYYQPIDTIRHLVIGVDLPQISPFMARKHFMGARVIPGTGPWKRELVTLKVIADDLEADAVQTIASSCRVQGLCFKVFERILEGMPLLKSAPASVRKIIEQVDRNIATDFRHAVLEHIAGSRMKSLNRDFRSAFGVSATTYIRERRIARATDLLINSDWNLDRIAEQVGFGNRSYLSRVFSHHMGMSPSVYRSQRQLR